MVLVCLNRKSFACSVLGEAGVLCVNVLRADAEATADAFAGRGGLTMEERFATTSWTTLATGAPVLENAVVSFDCRVVEVKSVTAILPVHRAQLLTYLRLTGCPAGLLINFHVAKLIDGVRRVLNQPR